MVAVSYTFRTKFGFFQLEQLFHAALDARGWWLILIALILFMVSSILTYLHHDIIEMYRLQGLPQAQIDQIQKMGLFTGHRMGWFTALCSLPFLGYLLFIKKYLRKG